jgi:hypothetical protein
MRLWSLHPKYLDAAGLVALWREGLLAQKVLGGGTTGYRNHPQLVRFREQSDPRAAVSAYLSALAREAAGRGYTFDIVKILPHSPPPPIAVSSGQLAYEWDHLRRKLQKRRPERLLMLGDVTLPDPHPLFIVVDGEIEAWEKVRSR